MLFDYSLDFLNTLIADTFDLAEVFFILISFQP